jgi:PEP-CTERM motif
MMRLKLVLGLVALGLLTAQANANILPGVGSDSKGHDFFVNEDGSAALILNNDFWHPIAYHGTAITGGGVSFHLDSAHFSNVSLGAVAIKNNGFTSDLIIFKSSTGGRYADTLELYSASDDPLHPGYEMADVAQLPAVTVATSIDELGTGLGTYWDYQPIDTYDWHGSSPEVPVPGTLTLLGIGAVGFWTIGRIKRRQSTAVEG